MRSWSRVVRVVVLAALGAAGLACKRGGEGGSPARESDSVPPARDADASAASARAPADVVRDSTPTGAPDSASRPTVLFVGTSLTAGLGLDPEQAFPALIQRRIDSLGLNYRVVNAGYSGETSAGALARIDWLMRTPADVVVLETGANDGLRGMSVDAMRANVQAILDRIRTARPRSRIVLVGMEAPPNLGEPYTSEFRRVFLELAAKNGATLVPFLLEGVAGEARLNQSDGIHPNVAGARIVADNVWRVLAPLLASPAAARVDSSARAR